MDIGKSGKSLPDTCSEGTQSSLVVFDFQSSVTFVNKNYPEYQNHWFRFDYLNVDSSRKITVVYNNVHIPKFIELFTYNRETIAVELTIPIRKRTKSHKHQSVKIFSISIRVWFLLCVLSSSIFSVSFSLVSYQQSFIKSIMFELNQMCPWKRKSNLIKCSAKTILS